jgi:hypothetical protein
VLDCIYRYLWSYQHNGDVSPESSWIISNLNIPIRRNFTMDRREVWYRFLLYFRKIITRLTIGLLRIVQVMSVRCITVYRWCGQFAVAWAACELEEEGGWNGLIIMFMYQNRNLRLCHYYFHCVKTTNSVKTSNDS